MADPGWCRHTNLSSVYADDESDDDDDIIIEEIDAKFVTMQDELDKLEKEYQTHCSVLLIWKKTEEKSIRDKHRKKRKREADSANKWLKKNVLYHTFAKNQFNVDYGRCACSSISLMAIYNFLRIENRDLLKIKWSSVVKMGANLWKAWKKECNELRRYQDVNEAYNVTGLENLRESIVMIREEGGHLDKTKVEECRKPSIQQEQEKETSGSNSSPSNEKSFLTINEALTILKNENKSNIASTFTIRENTVSIFIDIQKKFWIFDSHGGIKEDSSTLVECNDIDICCAYLYNKYPLIENTRQKRHFDSNTFFMVFFKRS